MKHALQPEEMRCDSYRLKQYLTKYLVWMQLNWTGYWAGGEAALDWTELDWTVASN